MKSSESASVVGHYMAQGLNSKDLVILAACVRNGQDNTPSVYQAKYQDGLSGLKGP